MEIRLSTDRLFEDHFLAAEALTLGNIWNHRLSLDSQHTLDASPCWLVPQFGFFDLSRREIIHSRSRVPAASLSLIPFPPASLFPPLYPLFFSLSLSLSWCMPVLHCPEWTVRLARNPPGECDSSSLLKAGRPASASVETVCSRLLLHPLALDVSFFPQDRFPVQSFLCCFPDFLSRHFISVSPSFPCLMKNTSHT